MRTAFSVPFAAGLALCTAPAAANAQPSYAARGETITGTIASVRDANRLYVSDDRGYTDDVTLTESTAVLSNGALVEPGARDHRRVSGRPTFSATRISTAGDSSRVRQPAALPYAPPVYNAAPAYYPVPVYYPAPYYYGGFYGYRPYFPVSIGPVRANSLITV